MITTSEADCREEHPSFDFFLFPFQLDEKTLDSFASWKGLWVLQEWTLLTSTGRDLEKSLKFVELIALPCQV